MKETRADFITGQLSRDILDGKYGASGACFRTIRDLSDEYGASPENMCRVMNNLCDRHLIRLHGKRYYVVTGYAGPDTPYGEQLSKNRKKILGLILHSITNQYFASLTDTLSQVAAENGYGLVIMCCNADRRLESEIVDYFISLGASGIFAAPNIIADNDLYAYCPLPLVSIGRKLDIRNCDNIQVNNYEAGVQVADHLLSTGCRCFIYIGLKDMMPGDPRLKGYADRLAQNGYRLTEENIMLVNSLANRGSDGAPLSRMLFTLMKNRRPDEKTGVFCYHDLLASDTLQSVKLNNASLPAPVRIPDDVAIVGFDDLPIASVTSPPLTSVAYRYHNMAVTSMSVMLDYIGNPLHVPGTHVIPSSLRIRESTVRE